MVKAMNPKQAESLIEKVTAAGGFYETRKYRYYIAEGVHSLTLKRIERAALDTTAALDPRNHCAVYTILYPYNARK